MSYENKYDPKTGTIEGDHLQHLAGIGIHKLCERVNRAFGCDKQLTDGDLPGKVPKLIEQADKLASQLLKCESIHVSMAGDYIRAQSKIAGEGLPLMQEVLQKKERAVGEAVASVRANMIGKGGALSAAVADKLMENSGVLTIAEKEAGLTSWRTAHAICRDNATGKTVPRWLSELVRQHEAAKLGAVG